MCNKITNNENFIKDFENFESFYKSQFKIQILREDFINKNFIKNIEINKNTKTNKQIFKFIINVFI